MSDIVGDPRPRVLVNSSQDAISDESLQRLVPNGTVVHFEALPEGRVHWPDWDVLVTDRTVPNFAVGVFAVSTGSGDLPKYTATGALAVSVQAIDQTNSREFRFHGPDELRSVGLGIARAAKQRSSIGSVTVLGTPPAARHGPPPDGWCESAVTL